MNVPGRRFCSRCGAALGDPCCGFPNQPDDLFCGGCGRQRRQESVPAAAGSPIQMSLAEIMPEAAAESVQHRIANQRPVHLDQAQLNRLFEG